ncbi:MAG: type IV pilus secretin PilQ, partial [Desulfobacterales bacterium]|nr:type IV pilus secretin PilQ [Desulfobacterales bacterium]
MGKIPQLIYILLLTALLLYGCAGKEETPEAHIASHQSVLKELQDKAVSVTPEPRRDHHRDLTVLEDEYDPADTISVPLAPEVMPQVVQKALPRMPVTMKMHEISLPVLIRTLARVADIDIMITDTVQGQTSLAVTDVPWDQAFQGILDTFGLTYEWSGNILRVLSVEDIQKKQALMEARQTFETTRNQHKLAVLAQEKKSRKLQPLVTKIVKIHYADLAELQKNLTRYLSPESQEEPPPQPGMPVGPAPGTDAGDGYSGNILMDKFSNSLIIHATREYIRKLLPIIRRIDQPIRQVLIEAHIVEAESNTGKELGVQWGGLGTAAAGSGKSYSIGGNMVESGSSLEDGYTPTDGNIVDLPLSTAASGSGLALGVLAQKAGEFMLYAQLLALEEEGRLNILSTPSITTLDHRKAVIKSGR